MKRILLSGRALALVLASGAAWAGSEAPAWQANAKGLCQGPLCSLQLRVAIGTTLDLYTPGGSMDTGWNTLGPADIPLGSIGLPDRLSVKVVERTGDWSHGKAAATFDGGETLTLYASMLSPGIVIGTPTDRLRLFAGKHEQMVTFDAQGKMRIHGRMNGNLASPAVVTPARAAVAEGDRVRLVSTSQAITGPSADQPWILLWWGKASHFVGTGWPIAGHGTHQDAYLADYPLLILFDKPPASITAAQEGGLDFAFAEAGRRLVILPLQGGQLAHAADTQSWGDKLPDAILDQCRRLTSLSGQYPLSVRESFRYDAKGDRAQFEETVAFLAVRPASELSAPLPPVAGVALRSGLPVSAGPELAGLADSSQFGPVLAARGSRSLSWSLEHLRKYVEPAGRVPGTAHAPARLDAELDAQLDKLLSAGRLAPWVYSDHLPIQAARGEYYWGEPGEALYLIAQLYPSVRKEQQAALLECMADIRKAFPPETTPLMPPDKGARRGGYDVGPCEVSKIIARERGQQVSLFALYGLERYYALSGTKPTPEEWEACKKVIAGAFEEQGWATLYHLGHPDRFLPWEGSGAEREKLRKQHGPTDTWRGDRPCTVVNVNRRFSGTIGAIRLARLMGDQQTEQQAWWLFARTAVLRFALAKYGQWRYQAGLATIPPKPDWFWTWRGRGPQNWCGDLETNDWSKPEHDVQQVVELAPDLVQLGHWAGEMGDQWTQWCTAEPVAFRYLTPELACFLGDHLKPECAAYADRIAWNQPTWYASFAEAILGYEHNMNHPSDAYEHFMARAWILGERPERLEKWIDVPWVDRGDLFHLNKLAETLKAYRGVAGEGAPR